MPYSVNRARQLEQCRVLAAGEKLETRLTIYAGPG
jgi:hypothetical protein